MANNAKHDENSRPTIICASKTDGVTIIPIQATGHAIAVLDGTGQPDNGNNNGNAIVDENGVGVWTALASDGSGRIIEIYGDAATGSILIKSL